MDGYLSKPVRLVDLKAALDRWLPPVVEDSAIDSGPQPANAEDTSSEPVDVSVLRELVGDDAEFLRTFLHDFRLSAAGIASDLRLATDAGQAIVAGDLMHKLKSSARWAGALGLGETCAAIEQAGLAGDMAAVERLLPKFERELAAVQQYLDGY